MSSAAMHIESFFDPATFTFSHILADLSTPEPDHAQRISHH
jgi:hypothetical protein